MRNSEAVLGWYGVLDTAIGIQAPLSLILSPGFHCGGKMLSVAPAILYMFPESGKRKEWGKRVLATLKEVS